MRMTEFICYCQEPPSSDTKYRYSHIDLNELNQRMIHDYQFRKTISNFRKAWIKYQDESRK